MGRKSPDFRYFFKVYIFHSYFLQKSSVFRCIFLCFLCVVLSCVLCFLMIILKYQKDKKVFLNKNNYKKGFNMKYRTKNFLINCGLVACLVACVLMQRFSVDVIDKMLFCIGWLTCAGALWVNNN